MTRNTRGRVLECLCKPINFFPWTMHFTRQQMSFCNMILGVSVARMLYLLKSSITAHQTQIHHCYVKISHNCSKVYYFKQQQFAYALTKAMWKKDVTVEVLTWDNPRWTEAVSDIYMILPSGATTNINPSNVCKEKTWNIQLQGITHKDKVVKEDINTVIVWFPVLHIRNVMFYEFYIFILPTLVYPLTEEI